MMMIDKNIAQIASLRDCMVVAALILPLSGCMPAAVVGVMGGTTAIATSVAEERGVGGVITDAGLKSKITDRLNDLSYDLANKLLYAVYQRQVILTGTVDNEKMQIDAVRALWEIPNIEAVYDEIQIGPMTTMSQITKDSWISTQLKTQLLFSKKVISINYEYVTHEGIIYLVGVAQDQAELDEVIHIARTISGVKKVVNHIKLKNQSIQYRDQGSSDNRVYSNHRHNPGHINQPYHESSVYSAPIAIHDSNGPGATMPPHPSPYYAPPVSAPEPLLAPATPAYGPNTDSAFND